MGWDLCSCREPHASPKTSKHTHALDGRLVHLLSRDSGSKGARFNEELWKPRGRKSTRLAVKCSSAAESVLEDRDAEQAGIWAALGTLGRWDVDRTVGLDQNASM